jgi:hypothetical protein
MIDEERANLIYRIAMLEEATAQLKLDCVEANRRAERFESDYQRLKIATIGTRHPYDGY